MTGAARAAMRSRVAALAGSAALTLACVLPAPTAFASLPGAAVELTRAPYLTDLTTTSLRINWATTSQSIGLVRYGPPGDCAAATATASAAGTPITVNSTKQYQNTVALTGLSPATKYCYRVYAGTAPPVDLLGSNATPAFTTLESAGSTAPFTFAVFGDWGDTTNSGVNDGALNANQAGLDAQLAASGARFALSTGDIGYPSGTQNNYGDLNQVGANVSGVFGPSYWAAPGQVLPMYTVSANHGRNATFINNWPQSSIAASGVYAMISYPSVDGALAGSYPTSYYAFDTGGIRIYMLDASWGDSNVGNATGGSCGSHCAMYQVDHDAHWTTSSDEYRWLEADLAQHPGSIKVAAFHFPLRSDDATEPNDAYLLNASGSVNTLEQLLHDNGVRLVFNGHSHDYQRNVAPPGGVISYVSGGGGAKLTPVSHCSSTDAYAVGWSYSSQKGSACGAATPPTVDSEVFHYLLVHVDGTTITVTPVDSGGRTFDTQTYPFGPDSMAPSAPGSLTAIVKSTKTILNWTAATDNVGVAAYDIYRNGAYLATIPATATTYSDLTAVAGTGYTYRVAARDLTDNTSSATVVVGSGGLDVTPPTAPASLSASSLGLTSAGLAWAASTDDVGVTQYVISRDGIAIVSVPSTTTSFTDGELLPSTTYSYVVMARDAAGNVSQPSPIATMTTDADTSAPTAPGTPSVTAVTYNSVSLTWAAAVDNVGVLRYDIVRNGAIVGQTTGTSYTDTTVNAGVSYEYTIVAWDAAGNSTSSGPTTVFTPPGQSVFYDNLESGGLTGWSTISGITVQSSVVHAGSYACRETSSGTGTYAYANLPGNYAELWAQAWVNVVSRSTSASLFGFRTASGASIVNVYIDASGRLSLRNNIGSVTSYSTSTIAAGSWHRVTLHAVVNGSTSSLDVGLDGVAVSGLTLTGQNLGTAPITKLQLGDTATGRTYDIAFDDVQVSPVRLE